MTKIVHIKDGNEPTLKELQGLVGGFIQLIELPDGRQMVVNEEGRHLGLAENPAATALAKPVLFADDYVVGDAVVLSGTARLT